MGDVMKNKPTSVTVRLTALACGLTLFLALPGPAHARLGKAERARAEAKAMEAKIEFKSGNHAKAAQLFLEAFAISRAPALMYNAARAYQKGAMPAKAIIVFEQYLDLQGLSAAGRAEAKGHIETLKKQVAAGKAAPKEEPKPEPKVEPKPEPKVEPKPEPKGEAKPQPVVPPPGVVQPAPADERGKWVTWGLLGGGGLLFLIGTATMSGAASDLEAANNMDFGSDNAKQTYNKQADSAKARHSAGIFFTLAGLGLGGWGAWRMFMKKPATTAVPASAWFARPQVGRTWDGQAQYGLTVGGHFR